MQCQFDWEKTCYGCNRCNEHTPTYAEQIQDAKDEVRTLVEMIFDYAEGLVTYDDIEQITYELIDEIMKKQDGSIH